MRRPDYNVTKKLIDIRKRLGLSQDHTAQSIFDVRRKTLTDWENANASPRENHRMNMLRFLLEDPELREETARVESLWTELMVEQWRWKPFTETEQWILREMQARKTRFSKPLLPPYVISHELVGRNALMEQLSALATTRKSLALTGMPGVGKTAIVAALAENRQIKRHFKDGVLWAGLGPKSDVEGWLLRWASMVGRDVHQIADMKERAKVIRSAIGDRHMLLIIDDAWNIDDAKLLRCGGPNCCHLLTSRNQSITEEFATPTTTIHIPELTPEAGFTLINNIAPKACTVDKDRVTNLINMVGALPLALVLLGGYLAAPQYKLMAEATNQALDELSNVKQRLALAQQRLGSIASKQVTLEEIITLSLDDLPDQIVHLFHSLGAFASKPAHFDAQAVRQIAQCEIYEIGVLLDRNLLEITQSDKLLMHQVLADYARSKTDPIVYERHLHFYFELAKQDRNNWHHIEAFYQQLRWAWHYVATNLPKSERALALLNVASSYQERRGLWDDYLTWSKVCLDLSQAQGNLDQVALLLTKRASVYAKLGDRVLALELYVEALNLKRQLNDAVNQAYILQNIAGVFHLMANLPEALNYYQQALNVLEPLQDLSGLATLFNNMGQVYTEYSKPEEALDYLYRGLALSRQLGNKDSEAASLLAIAAAYIEMTDNPQALLHLNEAQAIAQQQGNRTIEGMAYQQQGTVHFKTGHFVDSISCVEAALSIWREIGHRPDEARSLYSLATNYRALGQLDKALDAYHDALMIQVEVVDRFGQLNSLGFIGVMHEEVDNLEIALSYFERGLELAGELHNRLDEAALLQKIGDVYYRLRDFQQAQEYYTRALNLALPQGILYHERALRINLAYVHYHLQQFSIARQQMERAVEIDQRISHPDLNKDRETLVKLSQAL